MAEGSNMDEAIKNEMGDNTFVGHQNEQPFALLFRMTQLNGKALPIEGVYRESNVSKVA